MKPAIKVEGLSKQYVIGGKERADETFREMLVSLLSAPFRRLKILRGEVDEGELFWAIRDINFEVKPGEVIGIIGRNGAGKSTLLKILSRITDPTEGQIKIRGRVASLLEVGTGFHPELTGHENIYLNGALLGMTHQDIHRKFDEIVAFSEVEKFLDTPVKRYSSGMYMRLAFAVAAHLDQEILLVDEVLAVGDMSFQKKCLGKMDDVAKQGRTVFLVSHNMGAIAHLCQRGLVISNGRIVFDGPVNEAIECHSHDVLSSNACVGNDAEAPHVIYQMKQAEIEKTGLGVTRIEMLDARGKPKEIVSTWDDVTFRISFCIDRSVQRGSVEFEIKTVVGANVIYFASEPDSNYPLSFEPGKYVIDCTIRKFPLAAGEYVVSVGLAIPKVEQFWHHEGLAAFTVYPKDVYGSGQMPEERRSLLAVEHSWKLLGV